MSRVVNPENAGKLRNQHMRTAAEVIRRLSLKPEVDSEARDMAATLVLVFREIEDGIEESMLAWEKRNYWNKVEQFRSQWSWVGYAASKLEGMIRAGMWEQMPEQLLQLMRHFNGIVINKYMRGPETWAGAYNRLIGEQGQPPAAETSSPTP
jgi:hypothetical protein